MCTLVSTKISCRKKLQDPDAKLSECGVQNGCTISLIMLPPFELYVQGTDHRMHTVVVPSSEPEVSIHDGNHNYYNIVRGALVHCTCMVYMPAC